MTVDPLIGRVLGDRYRLTRKVGEGGFGFVYAAEHVTLGSPFAVKILRRNLESNPQLAKRFEREARVTANLQHPGIVRVTDYGHDAHAGTYLVMEHLRGEDLSDRLERDGALEAQEAVRLFQAIVEAFAYAHRAGVVHRDVKSANIFLVDDEHAASPVKVLDFGIAHLMSDDFQAEARLTAAGAVLGSVYYMSPEQALGAKIDRRSDLYSLGIVFFEMLTGSVPFTGASALEVLSLHVKEIPRPPSITRTDRMIPLYLDRIVMRCLQKSTRERYQDAEQIVADLKEAEEFLRSAEEAPTSLDARVDQLHQSMLHDVALLADASSREQRRIVSGSSEPGTDSDDGLPDRSGASRPRWLFPSMLALAAVAAGVVMWLAMLALSPVTPAPSPPPGDLPSTEAPVAAARSTAAPPAAPAPVPTATNAATVAAPAPPAEAVEPDPVAVEVTSEPSGAAVHWTDAPARLGVTPFAMTLAPRDDGRALLVTKEGFRDKEVAVDFRRASETHGLLISLTPLPAKPPRVDVPSRKTGKRIDDL